MEKWIRQTTRSTVIALTTLAITSMLMGCSRWKVVTQAAPNPFMGQRELLIEPVNLSQLQAERNGDPAFEKDKQMFVNLYTQAVQRIASKYQWLPKAKNDTLVVRTKALQLDGGVSMGLVSTDATAQLQVQLLKNGQVMDEIMVKARASQQDSVSIGGIATGGYTAKSRIRSLATKLADYVADYLNSRTNP